MNLSSSNLFSGANSSVGHGGAPSGASRSGVNAHAAQSKSSAKHRQSGDPDLCNESLLDVIESQIIPRLLEAHPASDASNDREFDLAYEPTAEQIDQFARLCLSVDEAPTMEFLQSLLGAGVGNDNIFLNLIAPAARHLGRLWDQDDLDFTQVTLGLMRMHQITHQLGYEYHAGPQHAGSVRRIMLASAPGSHHILGLAIVAEFFRKNGWQVVLEIANSALELDHAVKNEWFDLIGLSVGLVEQISTLPLLIDRLRSSSRNPSVCVLLGGPAFLSTAVTAQTLGANGISTDALEAIRLADTLVDSGKRKT